MPNLKFTFWEWFSAAALMAKELFVSVWMVGPSHTCLISMLACLFPL